MVSDDIDSTWINTRNRFNCGGFGVILFFMVGLMMIYKQFDFESETPKSKVLRHLPIANLIVLIVLLLLFGVDIID